MKNQFPHRGGGFRRVGVLLDVPLPAAAGLIVLVFLVLLFVVHVESEFLDLLLLLLLLVLSRLLLISGGVRRSDVNFIALQRIAVSEGPYIIDVS